MSSSEEEASRERTFRSTSQVYTPSFCILHGKKDRNQTFCIPSNGSYHERSIAELRGMRCRGSCYGWLILQSYFSDECYLFNVATLKKIQLPPLPHNTFTIGVLRSPPSDPNCVIMFFSEKKRLCIFCKIGDGKWMEQAVRDKNYAILVEDYESAVSSKGKIYLFFRKGVAVIDVRENLASIEVYETNLPPFYLRPQTSTGYYYLEDCGEFFLVIMVYLGSTDIVQNFFVFKLDFSKLNWEKVESLENRIFLLGEHSDSASLAPSEFGAKGNCIYFFVGGRTELYIFDMNNDTITMSQLCPTKFPHSEVPFWLNYNAPVKKEVAEVTEELQDVSSNFPPELLGMIFQCLHLGGIIRFRLANKAFISIPLPVRPCHPQALSNSQHIPWLIFFRYRESDICHFYHPIYTDVYTMNLPQLGGAIVRHAKFGWLLMSLGRRSFFFFNPFTMETIKLPEYPNWSGCVNISFSAPPTSSDFVVFALNFCAENFVLMSAYYRLHDRWSRHVLRDRPYTFVPSDCNPVFHNGVFYCLSKDGKLGIFNPNETNEDDVWKVYTNLSVQDVRVSSSLIHEDNTRSFIMECDGKIFSVFVGFVGSPVRVYKFVRSTKKMKWRKVKSLGERLMFLSHTTSLLLPAVLKGTENRIYFPRFKGNSSVFYSLSSGNYHSFREQEPRLDWIGTSEQWHCTWFQNAK